MYSNNIFLKRNKILTKKNLISRGWTDDTSCSFCGAFEFTDHIFVHCSFTIQIWKWIAAHNNFIFDGYSMDDVWFLNAAIPLKNKPVVELVRGAVLWCIWLERNRICFQNHSVPTLQVVGSKIISLASFWCKTLNDGSMLHLSLILPFHTNDMPCQVMIPLGAEVDSQDRDLALISDIQDPEDTIPMRGIELLSS